MSKDFFFKILDDTPDAYLLVRTSFVINGGCDLVLRMPSDNYRASKCRKIRCLKNGSREFCNRELEKFQVWLNEWKSLRGIAA